MIIEFLSKYWVFIVVGCIYVTDRVIHVQKTMPLLNLSHSNVAEIVNGFSLFRYRKACKDNGLSLKWFWLRLVLLFSFWVVIILSIVIEVNAR